MESLRALQRSLAVRVGAAVGLLCLVGGAAILYTPRGLALSVWIIGSLFVAAVVGWYAAWLASKPLEAITQAVLHVAPETNGPAPETDKLAIGREYVSSLAYQIYRVHSLQNEQRPGRTPP